MQKEKVVFFSPVDPFGKQFGGTLDVRFQIDLLTSNGIDVFIFFPGVNKSIRRLKWKKANLVLVSKPKSRSILRLFFLGAAIGRKPFFAIKKRFFKNKHVVFQGSLTLGMTFFGLFSKKRLMRVHNKESIFHYDRFKSSKTSLLKYILLIESFRLCLIELYVFPKFKKIFISSLEYLYYSDGGKTDILLRYYNIDCGYNDGSNPRKNEIFVLANLSLDENYNSFIEFVSQFQSELKENNFKVCVYGRNVDRLKEVAVPSFVDVYGDLTEEQELDCLKNSKFYLVSSHNRGGYKTRISQALSCGCFPLLYGKGAEVNGIDFSIPSSKELFVDYSEAKTKDALNHSLNIYFTKGKEEQYIYLSTFTTPFEVI